MGKHGIFIVLEGPDGSGTTFHSSVLTASLQKNGYDVLHTAEPTDCPIGREIRRHITGHLPLPPTSLQLLFTADRSLHCAETLEPALQTGKMVICDRYIPSTLAYGEAAGVDSLWLRELNKNFIQPDATLYLLPPLSVCLQRLSQRQTRDALESSSFQERVHRVYQKLLTEDPYGQVIDTSGSKDDVMPLVFAAVQKVLQERTVPMSA
ncbi:dTMP kinase [Candidatus Peribacteria bacterium RIFCSPLOWO2_12_FULL_55_15]|nr:MAG: dTMP kinase [Candidatus Peribacteria bacterium RIFCSPHIGHO2_01_FULL_54_22]OGJ62676.1 MAG: dTMP kinase [Candidatus Peribacteria bacterium RIFCSPHIGHO2_02_FULL_55_24]OGJ64787.1 MAG: dTMP kinase [Candidatus Peribacteria bacterium RIFCSPHIGHO2_12_FULL_54_10]OGJ68066.1 MAG: dTMP kinase [Candidatus Peribacteria bacterium RIFCSPLOWO2_01_FULL_54_110]OGJ69026.1 MAG: dTMP kinase [Candidatus Peribacteria bacterium RIFCSPLOWO2_02_FULL_55_36]OGJ71819.1 MAG: dTMP kinase [Candidatus Peribacteria bact